MWLYALGGAVAAAALGWTLGGLPDTLDAPAAPRLPQAEHPAEALEEAIVLFREALPPPPEPPPPPPEAPPPPPEPPPPPPPDVAELFRRDLTAIVAAPGGLTAWIVDRDIGARRMLVIGDLYRDGWHVTRIERQVVELTKDRERRIVPAFGGAASTTVAPPVGAVAVQSETDSPNRAGRSRLLLARPSRDRDT